MGIMIMVYSLLWVMQDFDHQQYEASLRFGLLLDDWSYNLGTLVHSLTLSYHQDVDMSLFYTYVHTCIHAYTHAYTCMHACTHACIQT